MKKLSKLKWKDFAIMNASEMKRIVGGGDMEDGIDAPGSADSKSACEGKAYGDSCSWSSGGISYNGHCQGGIDSPLTCQVL